MFQKISLRKIGFYVFSVCVPFVLVELGLRVFFAFEINPDLLFFGTRFANNQAVESFDKQGAKRKWSKVELERRKEEKAVYDHSAYKEWQTCFDQA